MEPKKILVVEDDKVTQTLIGTVLKGAGYQVILADTAAAAVKAARLEKPDLVTLDINLSIDSPGDAWDGFAVAGWLRRLNEDKPTPMIVISGSQEPDVIVEKAAAAGVYTYLPKPVEKAKLLAAVAEALK
jgi:CheY-like chemotaxis protein